jgi:DNA invertase Pin-like site-specific DNA recombinase
VALQAHPFELSPERVGAIGDGPVVSRDDVLVVRRVDRLGRNYDDVTEIIRTLMQRGLVVRTIINGMKFDGATQDPVQMAARDALIAFMVATAQAQAEATKEAQTAGIKAPRQARDVATKYRGRKPTFDVEQPHRVHEMLSMGTPGSACGRSVSRD